jgi:protein gp37
MGDLFFDGVTNEQIAAVFGVMAAAPRHTFQVLTKRARRMREWFAWLARECKTANGGRGCRPVFRVLAESQCMSDSEALRNVDAPWPLPNVWLGVSAENQELADKRIPELLSTPAALRFVSAEPLLSALDLSVYLREHACDEWPRERARGANGCVGHPMPPLSWIIVGGESGSQARPFQADWGRAIRTQCKHAKVALYMKQVGSNAFDGDKGPMVVTGKGTDPTEWPRELRVQQFPKERRA